MKLTRREFAAGLVAAGAIRANAQDGNALPKWREGEFQIHFQYAGSSESVFLVFPGGLVDRIEFGKGFDRCWTNLNDSLLVKSMREFTAG